MWDIGALMEITKNAFYFSKHKAFRTNLEEIIENYGRDDSCLGESVVRTVCDQMNFLHRIFINRDKLLYRSLFLHSVTVCLALSEAYPEVFKNPENGTSSAIQKTVDSWLTVDFANRNRRNCFDPINTIRLSDIDMLRKILAEYGNRDVVIRF